MSSVAGYPLDAASAGELNGVLDGSDLASCVVDSSARFAVVTLNVAVLPEGWRRGVLCPLVAAMYPVGRVAASHRAREGASGAATEEAAAVRPLDLADLDQVIGRFSSHSIDDWDLIDPAANVRLRWRDAISQDVQWGAERRHLMELWQDDGPGHSLEVAVWFDSLYLLDAGLQPVTPALLAGWRRRYREEMASGSTWVTSPPVVRVSPADALARISS